MARVHVNVAEVRAKQAPISPYNVATDPVGISALGTPAQEHGQLIEGKVYCRHNPNEGNILRRMVERCRHT